MNTEVQRAHAVTMTPLVAPPPSPTRPRPRVHTLACLLGMRPHQRGIPPSGNSRGAAPSASGRRQRGHGASLARRSGPSSPPPPHLVFCPSSGPVWYAASPAQPLAVPSRRLWRAVHLPFLSHIRVVGPPFWAHPRLLLKPSLLLLLLLPSPPAHRLSSARVLASRSCCTGRGRSGDRGVRRECGRRLQHAHPLHPRAHAPATLLPLGVPGFWRRV
jgi:hypothetical protein